MKLKSNGSINPTGYQVRQKTLLATLHLSSIKFKPENSIKETGFTLIELMLALLLSTILILGMDGLLSTALNAERQIRSQNNTLQLARFAMQKMVHAVLGSKRLLIPLGENPNTLWSESVRDVLAVTLSPTIDRDKDGWADANNDKDFLDINNNGSREAGEPERIDEDVDSDNTNDLKPGIINIDDDGDGNTDEGSVADDDEDGMDDEDRQDNQDNDNDNNFDEDMHQDMNKDGEDGILGIDDDFDGLVDEDKAGDDDEDGLRGEDWFDPVVFFLNGTTLMQRIPNLNPVDGTDYSEYPIAENVTQFRAERISGNNPESVLVDITLQISPLDGEPVTINTRIRVGAQL